MPQPRQPVHDGVPSTPRYPPALLTQLGAVLTQLEACHDELSHRGAVWKVQLLHDWTCIHMSAIRLLLHSTRMDMSFMQNS